MRREPRCTRKVEPVAPARIARYATSKKFIEPLLCGQLARRPALAQPAGPVGPCGLKAPAFKRIACEIRSGAQAFRRGQGQRWIAQRLYPPPERCEYPQASVLLVADVGGGCQQIAREAARGDADLVERRSHLTCQGLQWRLRDLIPEHGVGTVRARQFGDELGCGPLAQQQRGADRVETFLQGPQRLRQPPARRAA